MKKYSELLECWEQEAYHDHYGEDWLVEIGEGVKFYAVKCEAEGKRPTFAGLIRHIKKKRCCSPTEDGQDDCTDAH